MRFLRVGRGRFRRTFCGRGGGSSQEPGARITPAIVWIAILGEACMKISSQAPCRVDLAGSTLDIWPLYLFHENAVTVNFAVDRYTRASIEPRVGTRITIRSTDLNRDAAYESLDHVLTAKTHLLPLAAEIVRFFQPEGGFHLETGSEAPAGAGISGSSALIIATASAFNKWLKQGHSLE